MEQAALETLLSSGIPSSNRNGENDSAPTENDSNECEEMLILGLDHAAMNFLKIVLDDGKDEKGEYTISLETRVKLFGLIKDWVAIRRRTDISDPNKDDDRGVKDMQRRIAETKAEPEKPDLDPKTGLPRRPRGRPTMADQANYKQKLEEKIARDKAKSKNDDTGLAAKLAAANRSAAP